MNKYRQWFIAFGFLYIIGMTTFTISYIWELTFSPVPEGQREYVLMILGLLMQTIIAGGAGVVYLLLKQDDNGKTDDKPDPGKDPG